MSENKKVELSGELLEDIAGGAKKTSKNSKKSNEMNIKGQNHNEGTIVNTSGSGATVKTIQNVNSKGGNININF